MSARAAHRETTRRRIGRIAVDLFLRRGFQETTVDEIAEAAGVSRRTVFRHFETKGDALLAWADDVGLDLAEIVAVQPPGEPVFVTLRAALQVLVDYAEQDPDRIRRLKELTGPAGLFPALRTSKRGSWLNALSSALAARDRSADASEASLQITTAFSAYDWAMSRWLDDPSRRALGDLLDEAFRAIRSGFP